MERPADIPVLSSAGAPSEISLIVLSGPDAGRFYRLPRRGGTIGRAESCDVCLRDPGMSPEHARIEPQEGRFVLKDLDSRYGVFHEGHRVRARTLNDGDRVQLSGETVVRVREQAVPERGLIERTLDGVTHDPLTGLLNRRAFHERLEGEYAFARRHRTALSLLMLDVDFLARLNESEGHEAGNIALRSLGRALQVTVRTEDLVARYGGDEFVVLVRGYDAGSAERFGARLLRVVRDRAFELEGRSLALTASAGVVTYDPATAGHMLDLVARADAALFLAKRQGRDRVVVWEEADATSLAAGGPAV